MLGLFSIPALAQDLSEIINKHVAALGANADKLKSAKLEYTSSSAAGEVVVTVVVIPGHFLYQKTEMRGGELITYIHDTLGLMLNSYVSSKAQRMPPRVRASTLLNSLILEPIYEYKVNAEHGLVDSVSLVGEEKVEGDDCYKLRVVFHQNLESAEVYVSKQNYLIRKLTSVYGSVVYSDYKTVKGVAFAAKTKITNAQGTITTTLATVKPNIEVKPDKLRPPV